MSGAAGVIAQIALGVIAVAAGVVAARAVRRLVVGERAVAFDVFASSLTCGLLVGVAITDDARLLDLALVLGLLAFLGTVSAARFIERKEG